MESSDEKYVQRMQDVQEKLSEPAMKKKVNGMLSELSKELNCQVEFFFNVHPEIEEYEIHDIIIPRENVPMKLGDFIDHISQEDREFKMYIDPIYMKKGVNEINDVLTTTIKDSIIVVPVTTKK